MTSKKKIGFLVGGGGLCVVFGCILFGSSYTTDRYACYQCKSIGTSHRISMCGITLYKASTVAKWSLTTMSCKHKWIWYATRSQGIILNKHSSEYALSDSYPFVDDNYGRVFLSITRQYRHRPPGDGLDCEMHDAVVSILKDHQNNAVSLVSRALAETDDEQRFDTWCGILYGVDGYCAGYDANCQSNVVHQIWQMSLEDSSQEVRDYASSRVKRLRDKLRADTPPSSPSSTGQ